MKFDDAKPQVGKDDVRMADLVDILKFPKKQFVNLRLLDTDILPVKTHWVNIVTGKDRREVNIPKICVSFDPTTEADKKGVHCPYCELAGKKDSTKYMTNAIIREEQEDKPRKAKDPNKAESKSGIKDPNSESWTPVRVVSMPPSLLKKIQELKQLNKVRSKKTGKTETFSVAHPKRGCDIAIKFDNDAKGGDMYQVQLQERTPLSEEELEFLVYDLNESLLDECGRETESQANKSLSRMDLVEQETIEDDMPKLSKSKSKVDEDDDDDLSIDDDEEDDDDTPSKSKKSKKKSRVDDDEDDEDLDDDDLNDEDEEPSKKKSKKKKSKVEDDDEDDDEDLDDDDDEDLDDDDDEPVKKKKVKKVKKSKKKKSKVEDDDDEDDDDLDDDDDDEPF